MFKHISKFDKQNPIIGTLLGEIKAVNLTDELFKTLINSMLSIKDLEIEQHLDNLKNSKRLSKLEAENKIPSGNSGGINDLDGFPPTPSEFLPSPLSLDLNLLYDVPTIFLKNNKANPQTKQAVVAINNLLKEKEKVVISDKLNTIFPEATEIHEDKTADEMVNKEIFIPNLDKISDFLE